ncbi:hypothetical protein NUW58_g9457 [Xylaria curta]|uniref:Uncharacterized protein n=1 Tax=Xylaria curta TaxID=42375 RepID=A0ACC1MX21_9PEZI|nr:hypothetical protein NUW58_g9457 [Xylaria curta]
METDCDMLALLSCAVRASIFCIVLEPAVVLTVLSEDNVNVGFPYRKGRDVGDTWTQSGHVGIDRTQTRGSAIDGKRSENEGLDESVDDICRALQPRYHVGKSNRCNEHATRAEQGKPKSTYFWRLWDVWGRRSEVTHRKLHAQYGDVVRLGPSTLSFADPKALKTIYGLNKGFIKVCEPPLRHYRTVRLTRATQSDFYIVQQGVSKGRGLATLFSTTDNSFHAQLRRCVNSAFSMSALVQYEPFVDNTLKLFFEQTERLYVNNAEGCDLPRWLQFYAFDVIGEVTYSKRHGFLERNEDVDGIVSYLGNLFLYVAPVSLTNPEVIAC